MIAVMLLIVLVLKLNMPKKQVEPQDDVLMRVDKQTAEVIKSLSHELSFSTREVTRWLAWIGRKAIGRDITIVDADQKKQIKMSLTEYKKLSSTDLT